MIGRGGKEITWHSVCTPTREGRASTVLTFVEKCEVLLDDREQGDDRRLQILTTEDVAVLRHVSGRIEQVLEILE
jgi:hypothetical protein